MTTPTEGTASDTPRSDKVAFHDYAHDYDGDEDRVVPYETSVELELEIAEVRRQWYQDEQAHQRDLAAAESRIQALEGELFAAQFANKVRYHPYADTDAGLVKQVGEEMAARVAAESRAESALAMAAGLRDALVRAGEQNRIATELDEQAAHVMENAESLRRYPDHEAEARARELGSVYLTEAAQCIRLQQKLDAIRALGELPGEAG